MSYGRAVKFDAIREKAFGDITNAYTVLGGVTTKLGRLVRFTNSTDAIIYITDTNTEDQIKLLSNSFLLIDITGNSPDVTNQFLAKGTQWYVKYSGSAPTEGSVFVEILAVNSGN